MNYNSFIITLCVLFIFTSMRAQPSTVDIELQDLSKKLVNRLNLADFKGSLIVLDFTDPGGTPTVLGAYVANEFKSLLLDSDRKFLIKDREVSSQSNKFINILGKVVETASEGADLVIEDRRDAETVKNLGQNADVFFRPNSKDKSLRKVDAILDGTITEMGESYRLTVDVKLRKTNDYLASVKGDLSNTDALSRLSSKSLASKGDNGTQMGNATSRSSNSSPISASNPQHIFKKLNLTFELLECREVGGGRYLECELRVTSNRKDGIISISKNKSKIFNQENSTEHVPTSVNISDVTKDYGWAEKTLIRDTPVSSVITFEPNETVSVISRFQLHCYRADVGYFFVDISDIFVKR